MAIGLGPTIIVSAVLRNWYGWEAPPFWLDDVAAGGLLTIAGLAAIHDQSSLRGRLLSAAFALAIGVLWASFFEPLSGLHPLPEQWSALPQTAMILTLTGLGASIIGLVCSLPSARQPFIGTRPEPEKKKGRR